MSSSSLQIGQPRGASQMSEALPDDGAAGMAPGSGCQTARHLHPSLCVKAVPTLRVDREIRVQLAGLRPHVIVQDKRRSQLRDAFN